jgi:hypothetical protein
LDVQAKQQDPVQWRRSLFSGNAALQASVSKLILLRTTHPALQRNEIDFFYFHPRFDNDPGCRVFGYCRTAAAPLGGAGQVIVLANMGPDKFHVYEVPSWPWAGMALSEICAADVPMYDPARDVLSLGLDAFQVRVFTS